MEALIREGIGYVPTAARRYLGCGLDMDELIAAGNLGLVEAAIRFDAGRRIKFVTYAGWWIRKSIGQSLESLASPVRVPRYRQEKIRGLKQAQRDVAHREGRPATHAEVAEATGMETAKVRKLLGSEPFRVALDHPRREDGTRPLSESIEDPQSRCARETLIRGEIGRRIGHGLANLDRRSQQVIRLRFGLDDDQPKTLRQTGSLLDLSRERVRQIELRALIEIRVWLRG